MKKSQLTQKQERVLIKIRELMRSRGKTPTIEELRGELGYKSANSVSQFLDVLEEKGLIERTDQNERNILIKVQKEVVQIPVIGSIACGLPILAQQNIEGYIPVSRSLLHGGVKDFFVLRAMGDSMNEAGINDGDYVLVKSQPTADSGERVIALIDDEATIKIYRPSKKYIALIPSSRDKTHKPIILDRDFQIQGVVKDVIKQESLKV